MRFFLFLSLSLAAFSGCRKNPELVSRVVVAKVGPFELYSKDFANELAARLQGFDALSAKNNEHVTRIKKSIIDAFILQSIVEIWGQENGVTLSPEELQAEIDRIRAQYPNDLAFRRNLAAEHLSFPVWQKNLRHSLMQKKVFAKIREKWTPPGEDKMKEFYQENRAAFLREAQIRVRQLVTDREETALLLEKKLKEGKTFKELAEFSSAPEAATDAETDWIDVNTLEIFAYAYNLPVGGRSGIMKSPFGFHLIEVLEKRSPGYIPYDAAKEKIKQMMLENEEQGLYSSWLDDQLRRHQIYKNEKVIAAVSVFTEEN